ncbi:solute carrier family 2, facilitated glucose transporter member 3-like [Teleopsis dalmanni]|uniref:solute carrier family 2, facilitated glucose transporter member 3-like n=1 Tax=Teleopsis dalmanni TaxID=139649 RepID=UPI0018CF4646|nr:solute carrier family 2, facilitated glucose transporter member 3-like [Teleopsis dalmanni]
MEKKTGEWTTRLAVTGVALTLGTALPGGYCIGVMNNLATVICDWCSDVLRMQYSVVLSDAAMNTLWSAIVSVFLLGGIVGAIGGAWMSNKFGRKACMLLCASLLLNGAILFYCCRLFKSVELLVIGRFIVGISAGLTTSSLPVYLCELAPLSLRGTLGVLNGMGFTVGVVVGQVCSLNGVFGAADKWHIAISFYVILVIICFAPVCYFPESPKWLYIVKRNNKAAHRQLELLRGHDKSDVITKEIDEMETERNLKNQTSSFGEVLKNPALLLPIFIVCVYQGGQQLSGINAIFYYSVSIFKRAGMSAEAAELTNLAVGFVNLGVGLFNPYLMAKVNRRPLMLGSSICCGIFLFSFAIMLKYMDYIDWFATGCIACIFLYIIAFQLGIGPIPPFIASELFEVAPRSVAMSLSSISCWGCCFILCMAFPTLQVAWGAWVFLPFSITCAILFVVTYYYLPETRNRDISQVARSISNGFKSKVR